MHFGVGRKSPSCAKVNIIILPLNLYAVHFFLRSLFSKWFLARTCICVCWWGRFQTPAQRLATLGRPGTQRVGAHTQTHSALAPICRSRSKNLPGPDAGWVIHDRHLRVYGAYSQRGLMRSSGGERAASTLYSFCLH